MCSLPTVPDPARIACIGECMIELSSIDTDGGTARLAFAGDTANTAIYLSRLRRGVSYLTNLGTDRLSDRMIKGFRAEGIDCHLIGRHPDRLPGIYAIEVDAGGERSFRYWRDASAARTLFGGVGASLDDLQGFDLVYVSGITLAILPGDVREKFIAALAGLKAQGKMIVSDSNYRPRLWPDPETARRAFEALAQASTLALPSFDDELALYPGSSIVDVLDRLELCGLREIVLKNGAAGPTIRSEGLDLALRLPPAGRVVDSTGAGDSFNAGYLAARLEGAPPAEAAAAGHDLARAVIAHTGAIIPRTAMPLRRDLAGQAPDPAGR